VRVSQLPLFPGNKSLAEGFPNDAKYLILLALLLVLRSSPSLVTSATTSDASSSPSRLQLFSNQNYQPTTPPFHNDPDSSMRSCLKLTPPLTPQPYSCEGSPAGSGSASPARGHSPLPPCRKTVSFGPEPTDFFEVDDWDRSPAPVAPKLCYQ
jgi:hypothetical protein